MLPFTKEVPVAALISTFSTTGWSFVPVTVIVNVESAVAPSLSVTVTGTMIVWTWPSAK